MAGEQLGRRELQPGLCQVGRHPQVGKLCHDPLGERQRLGDQRHREQELAAVDERDPGRDAELAQHRLRLVVERERGGHVPGAGGDEAAVVPHLGRRERLAELGVQRLGPLEVGRGSGHGALVGPQDAAVRAGPGLPQPVARGGEPHDRPAVGDERGVGVAEPLQDERALRLGPRLFRAVEQVAGPVELPPGRRRAAGVEQDQAVGHAGLPGPLPEAGTLCHGDRPAQVTQGVGRIAQLAGHDAERPLGDRHRLRIAPGKRLERQGASPRRVALRLLDRALRQAQSVSHAVSSGGAPGSEGSTRRLTGPGGIGPTANRPSASASPSSVPPAWRTTSVAAAAGASCPTSR